MNDLAVENDILKERIAVLEQALGTGFQAPSIWRLTPSERTVLGVLVARELATKDALMAALYGARSGDAPESKTLDVYIYKLRHKLKARGIVIHTQWRLGWYLDPPVRRQLRGVGRLACP